MKTTIEFSVRRSAPGVNPSGMRSKLETLFKAVSTANKSALLLDFDGTLAPFRVDPSGVRPWAGVADLLDRIQDADRTHVVVVSGRPAEQVASRLGTRRLPEIWGLHGAERRFPDGTLEVEELSPLQKDALEQARVEILGAEMGLRIEQKRNSLALHWRGMATSTRDLKILDAIRKKAYGLLAPFDSVDGLRLLQFGGGMELRAGRNKGDAVKLVLREIPFDAPVAYLGDDATDEDAFRALEGRGVGVLIRRVWRPSIAPVWLRPPVQLRGFLRDWLAATAN